MDVGEFIDEQYVMVYLCVVFVVGMMIIVVIVVGGVLSLREEERTRTWSGKVTSIFDN